MEEYKKEKNRRKAKQRFSSRGISHISRREGMLAMTDSSERTREVRNKINQEADLQIVDWLLAIDFDVGHTKRKFRR